jgi:hypothetical protein
MMARMSSNRQADGSAAPLPEPGLYRHFKGGEYELLSVARHSETEELLVVYRALNRPDALWVRPLDMFTEFVERPEGLVPRFQKHPAPGAAGRLVA